MKEKLAIIGSGISGLASAFLLKDKYDIEIFEKNPKIGGHANTANINYDGQDIAVDTGFIVYNFKTYYHLKRLFEMLRVDIVQSDMSFGIMDYSSGLEYSGTSLSGMFAQKKNIFDPKYILMIKDILKFNKNATKLIEDKSDINENLTLDQFINKLNLGNYFKEKYLFPMASAIWSCPVEKIKFYPAKTFLRFFYNHGLLTVNDQPIWYSVKGGSQNYLKKLTQNFTDKITLNCEIKKCFNQDDKVILIDQNQQQHKFDKVIFASHGDEIYNCLDDKNNAEEEILKNFKFSSNIAILHKDKSQMPKNKKAWASWVYLSKKDNLKTSLTYWMNNLQQIDHKYPLFVTLNPITEIPKEDIFGQYHYHHPIFDFDAIKSQKRIDEIQGTRNIYYCGAWLRYGFHEDGILSAVNVAKKLGVRIPW